MKFSVVTVAFNAERTIGDTLRSVGSQDWPDYEHIVVDGLSSDDTAAVVRRHQHDRLRLISEPDKGCYDAMNKGLRLATGDIVVFVNADDFLARPDALRIVAEAFGRTGADCVVGQTAVVDPDDVRRVRRLYRGRGFRPWMLRFGHMPPHPSFYAKRTLLEEIGGFRTDYRISGDYDQMLRLFVRAKARMASVPETLSGFRAGGLSTSDFGARMTINREIARALGDNGIACHPWQLWLRYPFKALQLVRRPVDYPSHLGDVGVAPDS